MNQKPGHKGTQSFIFTHRTNREVDTISWAAISRVFMYEETQRSMARIVCAAALRNVKGHTRRRGIGSLLVHPYAHALIRPGDWIATSEPQIAKRQ